MSIFTGHTSRQAPHKLDAYGNCAALSIPINCGVITDPKALRDLVEHGRGQMPAVGHDWPKKQTAALFAYLNSHIAKAAGGGG